MHHFTTLPRRCFSLVAASLLLSTAVSSRAAGKGFTADQSATGVVVKYDGQPFATYVIGDANKSYLFPCMARPARP